MLRDAAGGSTRSLSLDVDVVGIEFVGVLRIDGTRGRAVRRNAKFARAPAETQCRTLDPCCEARRNREVVQ